MPFRREAVAAPQIGEDLRVYNQSIWMKLFFIVLNPRCAAVDVTGALLALTHYKSHSYRSGIFTLLLFCDSSASGVLGGAARALRGPSQAALCLAAACI